MAKGQIFILIYGKAIELFYEELITVVSFGRLLWLENKEKFGENLTSIKRHQLGAL